MNTKRPNIIFILIDDMGWKDLGCYGSEFYETPNIDRLAEEGMLFTDAYAACPVCSPTRASILSGKYPARVGVTDWIGAHTKGKLIDAPYIDHLPLSEVSLASALKAGGYKTWHVGKWHLGEEDHYPEHHGFDVNIAGNHFGAPRYGYFSPYSLPNYEDGPEGEYLTDRISDEAVEMIKNHCESGDDTPFFMYLSHYAVHTPIQAKEEDIKRFEIKAKAMGIEDVIPFEIGEKFPCDHKKDKHVTRRIIQSDPIYAAMIWNLDENIGKVLDTLDEQGVAEDTVIFFTSDNGGLATAEGSPTCNAPLNEGKGWMYEGGVREPLMVRWPGKIKAGSKCQTPVTSPDFYPTVLNMADMDLMPDQHVDGADIMPLLTGQGMFERPSEAIYWHYPHYGNQGGTPGASMRLGDYKLIEFFEDGRLELYNLVEDISEESDLADAMPELTSRMHGMLKAWQEDVEAIMPEVNPEYTG